MSRAIPSNFNEYLLDQTSRNTGIVCDGGIMPLRNNPDPSSLWYKNCLRGEDVMFLKEATAARRNDASNGGLDDTSFKPSRLQTLQSQIGSLIDSGLWTDTDPRATIGFHDMGAYSPQWSDVETYIKSCLHPITKSSAGDTYTNLDHVPIENLFKDVQKLAYTLLISGMSGYSGYLQDNSYSYRFYEERRRTSGDPTITDETRTTDFWIWNDYHREVYRPGYPDGLSRLENQSPISSTTTFTESTSFASYRRFHRYLESVPFGVFEVTNSYLAEWEWNSGAEGFDSWETKKYILGPLPVSTFIDTENLTTITLNDQTTWSAWVTSVFNAAGLEKNAANVQGRYEPAERRERHQTASIETPMLVFWVSHMKYCSLDGIAI